MFEGVIFPWSICFLDMICFDEQSFYNLFIVKNQGSWVQQYIESLSKIYVKTKDTRFNLIITDFESFDIDLEEALKRSPLPHWQVSKLCFYQVGLYLVDRSTEMNQPSTVFLLINQLK